MACLKMQPEQFFDLTPRAFQLAIKAYNKLQEQESKLHLEASRLSGFLAAKPAMSEEAQKKYWCPQLFYPFPWDEQVKTPSSKVPTEEMMQKARKYLQEDW